MIMNRRIRNFKNRSIKKFRQLFKVRALKLDKKWKSGGVFSKSSDNNTTVEPPIFGEKIISPSQIGDLFIRPSNEPGFSWADQSKQPPIKYTVGYKEIGKIDYSLHSIELLYFNLNLAVESENYELAQIIQAEINKRKNE